MNLKYEIGALIVIWVLAFSLGRCSVQPSKVETKIETNTDTETKIDKNVHKSTVTVTEQEPSGAVKTTTKTIEDTEVQKHVDTETVAHTAQTITPPKTSTLNVSGLVGIDLSRQMPVYGVSINKQLIGPITVGAYGLTNGTLGVSFGINF
jgi:hypothetical protein